MRTVLFCLFIGFSALNAALVDVYFSTRGEPAEGIYRAKFDDTKGTLSDIAVAMPMQGSNFLAFHPDKNILYAAGKVDGQDAIIAMIVDGKGWLNILNAQPIEGGGAAHLSVHPSGKFLIAAQYGGGSTSVFPLGDNGWIKKQTARLKHTPEDPNQPMNRKGPHPHWTGFSPDGRFAFVPDLGLDEIVVYEVLENAPFLEPSSRAKSIAGGGPRHLRFSTDGKFVFLLNELSLSVTTFAYDADTGELTKMTTAPALTEEQKAGESFNTASEILVHPNGQFVYSGNRGNDSVTAYRATPETGELEVIEVEPIRGAWPRNINLDPSGQWLLAAGMHSNTISVFSIDPETGELQYPRGRIYSIPRVNCILFND
ncbi:MAG: lactonase family protein [Verrucomicrobiota bacterium]